MSRDTEDPGQLEGLGVANAVCVVPARSAVSLGRREPMPSGDAQGLFLDQRGALAL